MCLTRKHTQWATLLELGYPLRPPKFGEEDVHLPESVMIYLRERGPLTQFELIPTGQSHLYSHWLRLASHPYYRKQNPPMVIEIEDDNLEDSEVISDPSLLLQYHLHRFRSAKKHLASTLVPAPTVIWGRSRRLGVDARSHSYLDGTPPRLNSELVAVCLQSRRFYETYSNFTVTIYQGVARIEDDLGSWELDSMRMHQIMRQHPSIRSQELRDYREDMLRAEKRGLGEPDFGVYPTFFNLNSPREISPAAGKPCHWLYLDSVPALDVITWCHCLVQCGGGVIAT
eukprot:1590318-Rhodomonas_salina.1